MEIFSKEMLCNVPASKSKYYYLKRSEPDWENQPTKKTGKLSNCATVKKFFKKKFQFCKQLHWKLPLINTIFDGNERNQTVPQLQWVKKELNNTKDKLNDYPLERWSKFTAKRDPSSAIAWFIRNEVKAEFVTKAWCKFYECLSAYPIVKVNSHGEFNSVRVEYASSSTFSGFFYVYFGLHRCICVRLLALLLLH